VDNDAVDEPDGTVTCTLLPGDGCAVNSTLGSHTEPILDDAPTIVTLARVGSGAVSEGGSVEFTVTLGRKLVAGARVARLILMPLHDAETEGTVTYTVALDIRREQALTVDRVDERARLHSASVDFVHVERKPPASRWLMKPWNVSGLPDR